MSFVNLTLAPIFSCLDLTFYHSRLRDLLKALQGDAQK